MTYDLTTDIMSINCEFIDEINIRERPFSNERCYEIECSDIIYNCLVMVMIPDMFIAKKTIIENFSNVNLKYELPQFEPYKSRLELNIPLLHANIRGHLYSLLNQFYDVIIDRDGNQEYIIILDADATHEDVDELVLKISDILSNKFLGKDIIKQTIKFDYCF